MRSWSLAVGVVLTALPAGAQVCTPAGHRPRATMVLRGPPPRRTPIVSTTVTTLRVWPAPAHLDDPAVRGQDGPIDPYESRAFTLTGDLWRVRFDEDCDLELEISDPGARPGSPRMLAAVPAGAAWEAARLVVLGLLPRPLAPGSGARSAVDLPAPVRVTVTGWAYYDALRGSSRGGHRASPAVRTLWELLPVWRVEVGAHCERWDVECIRQAHPRPGTERIPVTLQPNEEGRD